MVAKIESDRDPYETLDDLMTVVEALCPEWPRREPFTGKKNSNSDGNSGEKLVGREGLEPSTKRLRVSCSTN